MDYKNILYHLDDHVVTIRINRPEVHNCINSETARELQRAWKTFRDDNDAFVAIITGAGNKAFSAGWDLNDAADLTSEDFYDWTHLQSPQAQLRYTTVLAEKLAELLQETLGKESK